MRRADTRHHCNGIHRLLAVAVVMLVSLPATHGQRASVTLRATAGHNYTQSLYGAMAALGNYKYDSTLALSAGVELNTSAATAATLGWQAGMRLGECRLLLVNRCLWRRFAAWKINEFSGHVGAGVEWSGWRCQLGLATRMITPTGVDWLNESTDWIVEPFNLMYELLYRFRLDSAGRWRAELRAADFDDFVTDRAYQPLFSCQAAWCITDKTELSARALLHPTGMMSLSANYYEAMFNLGVKMLW